MSQVNMKKENIEVGKICFATYPINKSVSTENDMFFCLPLHIGDEYSVCMLFFGSNIETMRYKGKFTDVCTSDLSPLVE